MAWENFNVEQQRLQLVTAYIAGEASMTDLCIKYGISRKTAYKWYERYIKDGEIGLQDLSKAPNNPNFLYTNDVMLKTIDYKLRHRNWGPKKILAVLKKDYPDIIWPGRTRTHEFFKEYNLVNKRKSRPKVPATSPLGDLVNCNDTWSMDFKGCFMTGDGKRCEPLTIQDCVSRYLIRCTYLNPHTIDYIWPILDGAFREYGLPIRIRSDNGSPFGSVGVGRLTRLSVQLIKAGVIPEWIRPGHPEENGRHERFHLTLKQEVASPPKATIALQIRAMQEFHQEYNFVRPHESLDMKTPSCCYQNSSRIWDGILRSPEYDTREMTIRKVQSRGVITIKNEDIFIGEALIGEYIGLKPIEDNEFEIYFGNTFLGKLTESRLEKPKIESTRRRIKRTKK